MLAPQLLVQSLVTLTDVLWTANSSAEVLRVDSENPRWLRDDSRAKFD